MAQRTDSFITENEVIIALSFFQHVKARFASDPAVYEQFLRIFRGFSTGEITDPREVATKAYALLQGHPDLVRRLDAFFPEEHEPEPAHQDPQLV